MEVLVASMIGSFVALVAVGALKSVSTTSALVDRSSERAAELRFVSDVIHRDLLNVYREEKIQNTKFVASVESTPAGDLTRLSFWAVGRGKARTGQPEGDVYEVEYALTQGTDDRTVLMRRQWPNPDPNLDPGGVLTVISDQITGFSARFFDGTQWTYSWDQTLQQLPMLVEVMLVTLPDGKSPPLTDAFLVNLTRATGQSTASVEEAPESSDTGSQAESGSSESSDSGGSSAP